MRISELSPDNADPISHLQSLISELESLTSTATLQSLSHRLRSILPLLPNHHPPPLLLWKLSYRLWNACVDFSNSSPSPSSLPHLALLRNSAADLLLLAARPDGVPSPELKTASFFHRTALLWLDLRRLDLASACLDRAADLVASVAPDHIHDPDERRLLLDINLSRSRAAWESSDRTLAIALLNRSKSVLFGSASGYRALAEEYLRFGKLELGEDGDNGGVGASKLLEEALDLSEKGIRSSRGREEVAASEALRSRCLRFVAADRLRAGDYEGVLRCVKVLRGEGGEEEHPSVGFVALRAWMGMGRVGEAESEMLRMLQRKGVPESVCIAAAEELAVAGGAVKGVVVGLAERCGAAAAARVVGKVVGGGGLGKGRLVADLVSEERVVGAFQGGEAGKQRAAMHALIWNYGAEHFREKEYEMAAELFEKSLLYVTRDEANRSRRANCYRVLCLCFLGLSQLNRAEEFITEAEKLEPNINCAFLKLKIYLQKKAEKEGICQVEAMVNCVDFKPEYLTLSTHEAMACRSIQVAIASLSILLNLYSPGKAMPMPEVAVLRNIISLLSKTPSELEILKYTKRASSRMSEHGIEGFFGSGAVGDHELKWFAANSWNMGLKTGKEKKYESCVEFLELASVFYGAIPEKKDENNAMICKAEILSVAAMIASEEHTKIPLPDIKVKKALEMLDKAGKILSTASISTSSMHLNDKQTLVEPNLIFLHILNAYQLLGRLSEDPGSKQLQLIKNFLSSTKAITSANLLHLGLIASQGPKSNPEVANFVLSACLSELLASPLPDYQTVSLVIRKLIGLSTFKMEKNGDDCDSTYDMYQQAYRIIVGLGKGDYPPEEGKWLAMTAWNRSGMAIRMGQVEMAKKWMKLGLDLARHLSGMSSYIAGMESCLSNFEKIFGGCSKMCDDADHKSQLS